MAIDSIEQAFASGMTPVKVQKLVALGVAIALRSRGCIAHHVRDALDAGATRNELQDAVYVAVAIGGGSAQEYRRRLRQGVDQIDAGGTQPSMSSPVLPDSHPDDAAARR